MPPSPKPETLDRTASAVIFIAGIEVQGFGTVSSVNPARMPGARIELLEAGVLITTKVGVRTLVPFSMVKAVHL